MKARALKDSFVNKNHKQTCLENKKKYGGGAQNSELSNPNEKKHKNVHKGKRILIRERCSATVAINLAILLLIAGQTRLSMVEDST